MAINWGQIISAAAQVAGSAAAARASGKAQQAATTQAQDRGALDAYNSENATDLRALEAIDAGRLSRALGQMNQYELGLQAPGQRANNAVRGDILANAKDVTVSHPRANIVNFEGGLRPSMFSDATRQLGSQMSREALLSQMKGTPTPYSDLPETDFSSVLGRTAPKQTALPKDSALDKILSAIGTYGSLAAAVGSGMNQPTPTTAAKPSVAGALSKTPYQTYSPEDLAILNPKARVA